MMTIMLIMLGLAAIGSIVAATAPVGYQDEKGFHFGCGPATGQDESDCKSPS